MSAIELKLKHPDFAPKGEWFWICHENDKGHVDDTMVYYYVHDDIKIEDWKIGDKIELDDWFEILEIGQVVQIKRRKK